jgi:maltose alpha-D-glucosyltransferase/alpha-amylase
MQGGTSAIDDKLHWYKDAVIYELHIKAFRDSDGDGVGDFKGLMEKLDYLQELGVTAIWVLPFYPSPLKDDGYDIADYYNINPRYGNLEQFQEFLKEAHKRKLKIITELVINHTSDQHPWFQRARSAPKDSFERNFYVWTDDPTQYKDVRIIFQDFEESNWTWDAVAQQYYWHRFFHHQPDLNYDNPAVQEEILKIIDYWCAMGVDGFRLDAVPYLYERENTNGENLPETHTFLKKLRKYIDTRYPCVALLAEANMWPEDSASYFGEGDECHMNYHFPVMPRMFMALQQEDRYPITDIFDQTPAIPETCQWAIFLRNHDELTLEMVTDEERDFMYKVYAKDPKARINLGIRHRLAPLMDNNRSKIELMNSLLFSLAGTPVIYYGDEIGMGDNFYLGDRDGVRTPMQWSPDRNAGFSGANPQQLYLPVILDPEYHYEAVNVEMQRRNTSSLFWFMKKMISTRKNFPAFSRGDLTFLQVENPKILAFTRQYHDETLLVIANLSKYAQPAEIDLRDFKGYIPMEVFSKNHFPVIREDRPYLFTLGAHSFQWFALQRIRNKKNNIQEFPVIRINEWDEIISGNGKEALEETVLPFHFAKQKWFRGRGKKMQGTVVKNTAALSLSNGIAYLLLVEVMYESGLPETYQLALSCIAGGEAERLPVAAPSAVIAQLFLADKPALLCDAFYLPEMHDFLLRHLTTVKNIPVADGTIGSEVKEKVAAYVEDKKHILSKMHSGDENNTSITYDTAFFLKMYRKVDRTINPDVELSYFLSEEKKFPHVPEYLGSIKWDTGNGSVVLGMIQELIENHGDGQSYMKERINNYIERILARDRNALTSMDRSVGLTDPPGFDDLPAEWQTLVGSRAAEQAKLIGRRTAELHLALAGENNHPDFKPEEYSLHYQRSLFSSMQALVREGFDNLEKNMEQLPEQTQKELLEIKGKKEEFLNTLRRIYARKLDIWKVRIHGSYNLKKLLFTGRDIMLQDFGGNPYRSYSERRIKRSPVRDVAEMITSFHYTAYEGFFGSNHILGDDVDSLLPFAECWAQYMCGFFLKEYVSCVSGSSLLPKNKNDFEIVLHTFLLEKALIHFNFELKNRTGKVIIPLRMIKSLLQSQEQEEATIK